MVLVAAAWSLTSAFDKMGLAAAPSLAAYLAVQRLMTAAPCVVYLLMKDTGSFRCDPNSVRRLCGVHSESSAKTLLRRLLRCLAWMLT